MPEEPQQQQDEIDRLKARYRANLFRSLGFTGLAVLIGQFVYIYTASAICLYVFANHELKGRTTSRLTQKECDEMGVHRQRVADEALTAMLALVTGALISGSKKP